MSYSIERIYSILEKHSTALNEKVSRVKSALDYVVNIIGLDFFASPYLQPDDLSTAIVEKHPLLRLLYSDTAIGIAYGASEILDLEQYLKSVEGVPNNNECIVNLRNFKQYENTRFHLAMADMLAGSGYVLKEMEPVTLKGKSDILVQRDGADICYECYRMNYAPKDKHAGFELMDMVYDIFGLFPPDKTTHIELRMISMPSNKSMRKVVRWAVNNLPNLLRYGSIPPYTDEYLRIEMALLSMHGDDPHVIFVGGQAQFRSELNVVGFIEAYGENRDPIGSMSRRRYARRPSRCILHGVETKDIGTEVITRMEKRLDDKVAQSRMEDPSVLRGLFVEIPYGIYNEVHDDRRLLEVVRSLKRKHEGLCDVHFTSSVPTFV